MEKSCPYCLYSNYTETTILMNQWTGNDSMVCNHPNSPLFNEIVNDKKTCRLFIDEKNYFKNRERIDKIEELKIKIKLRKNGI